MAFTVETLHHVYLAGKINVQKFVKRGLANAVICMQVAEMKEPTGKTKPLTITLPGDMLERLRSWEKRTGQPRSLVVRAALRIMDALLEREDFQEQVELIADWGNPGEDDAGNDRVQQLSERLQRGPRQSPNKPPGRKSARP